MSSTRPMHPTSGPFHRLSRPVLAALLAAFALVASGCTNAPGASSSASVAAVASPAGSRPSSPAVVSIVQPTPNEVFTGSTIHVVLALQNATIVSVTTTAIRPDQGHVHLYVDNVLVSMNYGLTQDLPVHPGTYVLKAEFVAADHAPFDPRVVSQQIAFTVN